MENIISLLHEHFPPPNDESLKLQPVASQLHSLNCGKDLNLLSSRTLTIQLSTEERNVPDSKESHVAARCPQCSTDSGESHGALHLEGFLGLTFL